MTYMELELELELEPSQARSPLAHCVFLGATRLYALLHWFICGGVCCFISAIAYEANMGDKWKRPAGIRHMGRRRVAQWLRCSPLLPRVLRLAPRDCGTATAGTNWQAWQGFR